jgi:murein DD-endopeptidase MepM/ murein hydrolase activator NlpD
MGPRVRIILGFLTVIIAIAAVVAWLSRRSGDSPQKMLIWSRTKPDPPIQATPALPARPLEGPTNGSSSPPSSSSAGSPSPVPEAPTGELIIPVAGVRPDQLQDTFSDARSDGRVHDAIDIAAPRGTPVLAAADGTIVKLFQSEKGGTTIYQLSTDKKYFYYYAHLERYVEGLTEGHIAKRGETLAYVGDTGNAGTGNYHLHFSIALTSDPKRYWEGTNINPYPLLKR